MALARVTTSKADQVVVSLTYSQSKELTSVLGRVPDDNRPANKLHMLDYEYQLIQFVQMSSSESYVSAID